MPHDLQKVTVSKSASLRMAMEAIGRGAVEIALVVGEDRRLLGTVTDGDIRRALLAGATLDGPVESVMNKQFTTVNEDANRSEVLDLMQARTLGQIPILDSQGRLVGLHLLREIVGRQEKPNWVVVMAGGRGERLRPLTDSLPKPMVRVAGRPILERIVLHLVGQGFRRIFLSVNYMSEVIEGHFGDGDSLGCEIQYLREKDPLGTGGALALLPGQPSNPLLVLNGDLLTHFDASGMLAFHAQRGYLATVGCYEYAHTVPYGVLDLDEDRVTGLREKPRESWTVNTGIYVLEPALLARVPRGVYFPLPALVEECLDRREPVGAYRVAGDWVDVGHHQELRRARGETDKP